MEKIKLLYVENIISRKQTHVQQQLSFLMRLDNAAYDKQVDVRWSGEDGIWHTLSAQYLSMQGNDKEYWSAEVTLQLTETESLPGNIKFGLRYRVSTDEYWDNNQGDNYVSEADSGVKLAHDIVVQNIAFNNHLKESQSHIPVTVAVAQSFNAKKVTIHWTIDHWKTSQKTACHFERNYWDEEYCSNARNPNQYGIQLWSGEIDHVDAFKLQYSICCENDDQVLWDNNSGNDYSFQREQLKVLILNLHCYQEQNQDEKFTQIAKAINELEANIICLQEVAEYWKDGEGDWESNSAKIINDRLDKAFHLYTDWSHLGFDKYREGVAILSRYPLSHQQSRYVSDSDNIYDIHSRKVVMARAHVPYIGEVNVFSAHLSWLEDGFESQFKRLHQWAEENDSGKIKATLLCGDFNITAGSSGYQLVVDSNQYDDQFLAANHQGVFERIFRVNDAHWQDLLADDYRIDYVFLNKTSQLQVTSAKVIFTEQDYGRVSDHCGYFMTFEPKEEVSRCK
ncbi:MAG: endonuclease [Methylomarinum sp.]|nr:endonuclease [Methylomarinum sp.]